MRNTNSPALSKPTSTSEWRARFEEKHAERIASVWPMPMSCAEAGNNTFSRPGSCKPKAEWVNMVENGEFHLLACAREDILSWALKHGLSQSFRPMQLGISVFAVSTALDNAMRIACEKK